MLYCNHNPPFSYFHNIAIGYENTPKYFISADCSFKVCEKPAKFAVGVIVVIVVSAWSFICIVNDYMLTRCPHSQRLCWHGVYTTILACYEDTQFLNRIKLFFFYFQRRQRLRGHDVRVVNVFREYLRKTIKKNCKAAFACSYGLWGPGRQKNVENLVTLSI